MGLKFVGRNVHRLVLSVVVLGSLTILHLNIDGGLPALSREVWKYNENKSAIDANEKETAELDERLALATIRANVRESLFEALRTGRITLHEACLEFHPYVVGDLSYERLLNATMAGDNECERIANSLLSSLSLGECLTPEQEAKLFAQFRHEFGRDPALVSKLQTFYTPHRKEHKVNGT